MVAEVGEITLTDYLREHRNSLSHARLLGISNDSLGCIAVLAHNLDYLIMDIKRPKPLLKIDYNVSNFMATIRFQTIWCFRDSNCSHEAGLVQQRVRFIHE
jgi:hypothetical protein